MSKDRRDDLIRIVGVEAVVMNDIEDLMDLAALHCYLENNELFTLYNIPSEIAVAIEKMNNPVEDETPAETAGGRESIFDILLLLAPRLRELRNIVRKVVIDSYDVSKGVYSASIHMRVDGITVQKRVIPSHAIFLSILLNKPAYVTAEVLEISRRFTPPDDEYSYESE
ncbi:MAG: hypothetical protein QXS42_02000 [Zestosphaera sp.]